MKEILKKHKLIVKMISIFISLLLFISILNYIGVFGKTFIAIFDMLIGVFMMFWIGLVKGSKRENKGYIGGLQVGIIGVIVLIIISLLIFRVKFNLMMIIYCIILLISATFGSMIGINKKRPE